MAKQFLGTRINADFQDLRPLFALIREGTGSVELDIDHEYHEWPNYANFSLLLFGLFVNSQHS